MYVLRPAYPCASGPKSEGNGAADAAGSSSDEDDGRVHCSDNIGRWQSACDERQCSRLQSIGADSARWMDEHFAPSTAAAAAGAASVAAACVLTRRAETKQLRDVKALGTAMHDEMNGLIVALATAPVSSVTPVESHIDESEV